MDDQMTDFIRRVALEAGRISLDEFGKLGDGSIDFKSVKDIVTSADRRVEEYIISEIRMEFPGHGIFAEESGKTVSSDGHVWVIDPIDGTTSFVHGQHFYSVSIALEKDGEPLLGAVNAPRLGELYWAERGKGAFCNGERLHVSQRDKLISSVLSTGFACVRQDLPENNIPMFCRVLPLVRGIRRLGSAALDLAYVAAGRLEGFWELNLQPYDIAAGSLLVREAGGHVCDLEGGQQFPGKGILATNGRITQELLDTLNLSS